MVFLPLHVRSGFQYHRGRHHPPWTRFLSPYDMMMTKEGAAVMRKILLLITFLFVLSCQAVGVAPTQADLPTQPPSQVPQTPILPSPPPEPTSAATSTPAPIL